MEYLTRRQVLLDLFKEYIKAKGYSRHSIRKWTADAKAVIEETGREIDIPISEVERILEKRHVGRWRIFHVRQAVRRYNEFVRWWTEEGTREYKEWLIRQGYSMSTAKVYTNLLIVASGKLRAGDTVKKNYMAALKAFSRFVRERFSPKF